MRHPLFDLDVERSGDAAVVRLRGELDVATVSVLEGTLVTLVDDDRSPVHRLVVDMSDLRFVDLAGLRPLLAARTTLEGRGGTVTFAALPYAARRILGIIDHLPQPAAGLPGPE